MGLIVFTEDAPCAQTAMLQETFDAAVKENQEEFGMEVNVFTFCAQLMQQQQKHNFPPCEEQSNPCCFGAARGSDTECCRRIQAPGDFC